MKLHKLIFRQNYSCFKTKDKIDKFHRKNIENLVSGLIIPELRNSYHQSSPFVDQIMNEMITRPHQQYPFSVLSTGDQLLDSLTIDYFNTISSIENDSDNFGLLSIRKRVSNIIGLPNNQAKDGEFIRICGNVYEDLKMILLQSPNTYRSVIIPQNLSNEFVFATNETYLPFATYKIEFKNQKQNIKNVINLLQEIRSSQTGKPIIPMLIYINSNEFFDPLGDEQDIEELTDICHLHRLIVCSDDSKADFINDKLGRFRIRNNVLKSKNKKKQKELEIVTCYDLRKSLIQPKSLEGGFIEFLNFNPFVMNEIIKKTPLMAPASLLSQIELDLILSMLFKQNNTSLENESELKKRSNQILSETKANIKMRVGNLKRYFAENGFEILEKDDSIKAKCQCIKTIKNRFTKTSQSTKSVEHLEALKDCKNGFCLLEIEPDDCILEDELYIREKISGQFDKIKLFGFDTFTAENPYIKYKDLYFKQAQFAKYFLNLLFLQVRYFHQLIN